MFTREVDAAEHFGQAGGPRTGLESLAGCQIKGHENNLLRAIREQEKELRRYRAEDGEIMRAMHSLQSEHAEAVRQAEELGFGRGVGEMQALAKKQFGEPVAV